MRGWCGRIVLATAACGAERRLKIALRTPAELYGGTAADR